jgi:vacuolar protein sorting-associated protein 26
MIVYLLSLPVFQSFLGGLFGPVCEIDVLLNDAETRKTAELKTEDGKVEKNYLFYDGESVSGKVSVAYIHTLDMAFLYCNK